MDPYRSFNYYNSVEANYNQQLGMSHYQNNWNNSPNLANVKRNSSIYINQNFRGSQVTSNKVLINPNFLVPSKVHINPSYIKTKGIFINPHVLAVRSNVEQLTSYNIIAPKSTAEVLVSTKNKWVRKSPSVNTISVIPNLQSAARSVKTPLKYTKYKIIRKDTSPKRKRRTSINLRYKLVRSNSNRPKSAVVNNKFRIDRRNSSERIKSKLYLTNKAYRLKVDHKISILKRHNLTSNKMTLVKGINMKRGAARMSRILNISGRKYKMDNNKMVLKLAMTGDCSNSSKLTVKVRKSDQSIKIPLRKKFKTNNIPCPTYQRFGICQRHKRGMCQKVHNPDQIIVCSKFLQGVCYNADCLLSHKICPSKMATCKFYLDGLCTKDGCPYLHVKVNPKVAICKDFLAGFCQLGKECDKRHERLCPDFEQNGRCSKRNCQFPHRSNKHLPSASKLKVRNVTYNKVTKNSTSGTDKISSIVSNSTNKRYYEKGNDKRNSVILNCSNVLGNESSLKSIDIFDAVSSSNVIVGNICSKQGDTAIVVSKEYTKTGLKGSDSSSNDSDRNTVITSSIYNRPQLGTLPTFIPF